MIQAVSFNDPLTSPGFQLKAPRLVLHKPAFPLQGILALPAARRREARAAAKCSGWELAAQRHSLRAASKNPGALSQAGAYMRGIWGNLGDATLVRGVGEVCSRDNPKATPHASTHSSQKPAWPDQVTLAGERAAPAKKHTGSRTTSASQLAAFSLT